MRARIFGWTMWPAAGAIGPFRDHGSVRLNRRVSNPESAARISRGKVSAKPDTGRLVDAAPNRRLCVVAVGVDHESALAQEGLRVGVVISVERRLALGGPMIVCLGRTRLALARSVAATVLVTTAAAESGAGA
jgi:Fe2+ transport system protein FeoA